MLWKRYKKSDFEYYLSWLLLSTIDGQRIGDFILAPGFTSRKRVQYQSYDVTHMVKEKSIIEILVSDGWYWQNGRVRYEIAVPTRAKIVIDGKEAWVDKGDYIL